ncbi:RDD family protein [Emticicia fontis]
MRNPRLAGFGKRFVAFIIDFIVVSIIFALIVGAAISLGFYSILGLSDSEGEFTVGSIITLIMTGISLLVIFSFTMVIPFIYELLMTGSSKQATVGKLIMNIKVIKENGQKLTMEDALIRVLVKYISLNFCFLLFLACLFNKEEQNLHDLAARTLVVEDEIESFKTR